MGGGAWREKLRGTRPRRHDVGGRSLSHGARSRHFGNAEPISAPIPAPTAPPTASPNTKPPASPQFTEPSQLALATATPTAPSATPPNTAPISAPVPAWPPPRTQSESTSEAGTSIRPQKDVARVRRSAELLTTTPWRRPTRLLWMRTSWPPPRRARAKPARCAALVVSGSWARARWRSEEHTSELQSPCNLVCRLLLEKKKSNTLTHSR